MLSAAPGQRDLALAMADNDTSFELELGAMSAVSEISRALVEERSGEMKESEGVAEVRDEPHGDSDSSSALGVDAATKVVPAEPLLGADKTSRQLVSRDFQCELTIARVAEAARAQRNAVLAGSALYQFMIDELPLRIVKVHRYRAATVSIVHGAIDTDEGASVAVRDPM